MKMSMNGEDANMVALMQKKMAEPLFIQRLEAALDMRPFMEYARSILSQPLTSSESDLESDFIKSKDNDDEDNDDDEDEDDGILGNRKRKHKRKLLGTKEERQFDKSHLYNFNDLPADREWLYQTILSDTDSDTEISDEDDYIKEMLKKHIKEQKMRENFYKKTSNNQYAYLSAGMLSNTDMFGEHQQSVVGVRKRKRRTRKEKPPKSLNMPKMTKSGKLRKPRAKKLTEQPEPGEIHPSQLKHYAFGDTTVEDEDNDEKCSSNEADDDTDMQNSTLDMTTALGIAGKGRKKKRNPRTPAAMAAKRKRVWQLMAKKELTRCHRAKASNHKEMLQNCKKVAGMCSKMVRQKATISQKIMKETVWRAKRLTREMVSYWKRYERVERDMRRRMEREAEEQRKIDVEYIEAKRQQRKLNFLITQTELYAHFMSKKLGQGSEEEQLRILNQLDEDINPRLAAYDDYDAEQMKQLAQKNAEHAFSADKAKTKQFDVSNVKKESEDSCTSEIEIKKECSDNEEADEDEDVKPNVTIQIKSIGPPAIADLPQPKIFQGILKAYQIKGMTWLANLYDQGISGILADEMGLGKTVQSIAFLCHIAEHYGVWGPFLIISPASTLHNWQQEMQRFVPDFNVVPYWGSPNERKILRQFWEQKDLHTKEASFHVVITSYQLIVSDYKYFNRIKWQYMVLDEAQAIKSATSMRWKLLLGFNCRNRLLLSGTPIQNSMAELWALLHFIMPTLFDSHDEFNEWFSKDIESHAENKTGIDEKQISRLHMILKPFMLRRIKKDVENELSDKIEIMVYCPLTIRQKLLYMALKKKIKIEDLLNLTSNGAGSSGDGSHIDRNFTSNLMNLVMQFRKVCNHPELFERRDAKSPFAMNCSEYVLPRLCFDEALLHRSFPSKKHLLYNRYSIFKADSMHHSLFKENNLKKPSENYSRYIDLNLNQCCFSFTRLCDLSPKDLEDVTINGLITYLQYYRCRLRLYALLAYRKTWWPKYHSSRYQLIEPILQSFILKQNFNENSIAKYILFTAMASNESTIYAFGNYKTKNMQETIEHRIIRSKLLNANNKRPLIEELEELNEMKIESDFDINEDSQTSMGSSRMKKEFIKNEHAKTTLLPEFHHIPRKPIYYHCEPLEMPRFLYNLSQRVQATKRRLYCESRAAEWSYIRHTQCENVEGLGLVSSGLDLCKPQSGWSSIVVPDKETLITDAGKLAVLDSLLTRLKAQGHRVLIYSQMTKMIDLLEEYMWHRKHRYMRLDGSSKISARRDMVADFQTRADIFVFLLSTRAGGLGINLTAADTVIFYDSDWNPTVDQQAMDRAHRLGQTKQVTVYRLICKGTIEERILQRAREKSEIQRMVISGGNFKPDTLKPKEVVSLLLDDEEIELKYRQKVEPSNDTLASSSPISSTKDTQQVNERKRRHPNSSSLQGDVGGVTIPAPNEDSNISWSGATSAKRSKLDQQQGTEEDSFDVDSGTQLISSNSSPTQSSSTPNQTTSNTSNLNEPFVPGATTVVRNDDSENESLIVDCETGVQSPTLFDDYGAMARMRRRHHPRGTRRGRPRGSTRRGGGHGGLPRSLSSPGQPTLTTEVADGQPATAIVSQPPKSSNEETTFTATIPAPVKRGPGRPRLKTSGPVNSGLRGSPRTRKPIGPLVVPLGSSPAATPLNRSPTMSPAPSPAHSERSNQSAASTSNTTSSTSGNGNVYSNQ